MAILNNIIKIPRGDTYIFTVPIEDEAGEPYVIKPNDAVYFGLMEPNKPFEEPILAKRTAPWTFNASANMVSSNIITFDDKGNYTITIASADTEHLVPGVYYYTVKLQLDHIDEQNANIQVNQVKTIINRTKFIIFE